MIAVGATVSVPGKRSIADVIGDAPFTAWKYIAGERISVHPHVSQSDSAYGTYACSRDSPIVAGLARSRQDMSQLWSWSS